MNILFFVLAILVFLYWLFGMSQPISNKPEILRGPLGGIGGLLLVVILVLLGIFL
jgi:hypothetical protein